MKTKSLLCALAGFGVVLSSCATDSTAVTRVEVSSTGGSHHSIESRILQQVNEYRRSQGLPAVRRHAGLDRMAREHSAFMKQNRGQFSVYGKTVTHYGFESRVLRAQHRHNMATISENVIAGDNLSGDIGATLVRVWVGSKGHKINMTQKWGVTGIGVVVDENGGVYATQLFGTPSVGQSRFAGPSREF